MHVQDAAPQRWALDSPHTCICRMRLPVPHVPPRGRRAARWMPAAAHPFVHARTCDGNPRLSCLVEMSHSVGSAHTY
eukprot:349932-Chlamydomonas_euryale.AAC.10